MNTLAGFLKEQISDTHNWTTRLLENTNPELWFITPEVVETNLAWQIGHLTLSQYFYTIVLIAGPKTGIAEIMDIKKYSGLFAKGQSIKELETAITVQELISNWKAMKAMTDETIDILQDSDLNEAAFRPHPFVKTKQDAISWNCKHTMWHCGQIALLKRVIGQPFDFGM